MSDYVICTESVLDIEEQWFADNNVHYGPLSFELEGYPMMEDDFGKVIPRAEFYQKLREGKNVTTSQCTVGRFKEVFEEVLQEGKDVVYVGFSSGLSGSYQSACIAAEDLEKKYPGRRVYCVDTLAAAGGHTMLAREAVKCREEGMDPETLVKHLEEIRLNIVHWFTVDDLFYLHRGGRVSKSAAVVGSLVGIKPILFVDDEGHLIPDVNVRGRKKSIDELGRRALKHMDKSKAGRYQMCISHGDCLKDAEYLRDYVRKHADVDVGEITIHYLDTVIGAHSGPGTLAIFFYGDRRGA